MAGRALRVAVVLLIARRAVPFKYFSYHSIAEHLHLLEARFPDLVSLDSAQRAYGLPSPGTCGSTKCTQWILTVTHKPSLRAAEDGPEPRPEVFFSGEIHGNERVGPTATVEFAKLLVTVASCVERGLSQGSTMCADLSEADRTMLQAQAHPSESQGQDSEALVVERALWMHRLVRTRTIVIMPTANALGYSQNTRTEGRIDPNRDFPYYQRATACMQSITARALNEVFRSHMFQLALTFHGGMQAIAYEWGSPNHPGGRKHKDTSPDDNAQAQIAHRMSIFGGKGEFSRHKLYPAKPMNSLVYPVHGGMEDWAYASSWDTHYKDNPVSPCRASGYPRSSTVYTAAMLRILNILVETSESKAPRESSLGSATALFVPTATDKGGNGHICRNVRLMLLVTDVVAPYVHWAQQPGLKLKPLPTSLAAVPGGWLWSGHANLTQAPPTQAESTQLQVTLSWRVGGAVSVDATQLGWGCAPTTDDGAWPPAAAAAGAGTEPSFGLRGSVGGSGTATSSASDQDDFEEVPLAGSVLVWSAAHRGHGRWATDLSLGLDASTTFTATLTLPTDACTGAQPFAMARAVVDQTWGKTPSAGEPRGTPPQSHLANARTNPEWKYENEGHVVHGRKHWYSPPVQLVPPS